jgi:hypothetical protein
LNQSRPAARLGTNVIANSPRMKYLNQKLIFLFVFCATSCEPFQNFSCITSPTDTISVGEDIVTELHIADPSKIIEHQVKYLNIDNCLSPGHCYHSRYEFNSCGKVANYFPPMVATNWHYDYDEQCRLISEIARDFVRIEISYFNLDSMLVKYYSITEGEPVSLDRQFKCKLLPTHSEFVYHQDNQFIRTDTIGELMLPCGEQYEGMHKTKTYYYENGLIESIQYFDVNDNLILVEDYQYTDSTNSPISFQ